MGRELDTEIEEAAESGHVRPYFLVELDYESGPVRCASTPFDLIFEAERYIGVGRLGSITSIAEGSEIRSYGVSMLMSGIPVTYFQDVVGERAHDRAANIWFGMLDSGHRPIGTPAHVFGGRMDVMVVDVGESISVTVTAESRLADWERARIRRYTDQDQRRAYPDDDGLEFVQASTDMELEWGRG